MKGALIILAVTVITGIILYILDRRKGAPEKEANPNADESAVATAGAENEEKIGEVASAANEGEDSECCGLHLVCEKELTAIAEDRILYYDDEELDRFAGRTPDEYNAEEVEEFRDVLMTMLPHDVPGWARSLDRRNIQPPREVRDELLIMLQDIA